MAVNSESFGGRRGILWVSGPGLRPCQDRQETRSPCAASVKEEALRPRPALRSLAASRAALPRGSAVARREGCVPGLAERVLSGLFSAGTRRPARTGLRQGSGLSRSPAPPVRPRPSPYRGVGVAEQADHQQEDPPAGVGAVAPQHAPGRGRRGSLWPVPRRPRHCRHTRAADFWSSADGPGPPSEVGSDQNPPHRQGLPLVRQKEDQNALAEPL